MTRDELRALRRPLSLLAVIAIAAVGGAQVLWHHVDAAEQRLRQESRRAQEALMRLQSSGREREIIVQNLGAYRSLERAGFVAPEQRLNWVTGLRNANQAAGLFGIEYHIGAQRNYRGAQHLNVPQLEVLESPMRLKVGLLHEEDLMRLFGALEDQHLGLYLLEECTVKRAPAARALRYQPQLEAECQMTWLTANARTAGARP
ncbi:MAG: hypothetical protein ACM3SS_08150 [Rhodospirillaceae bacterium]